MSTCSASSRTSGSAPSQPRFNIGLAILLFLAIRWAASIIVAEISHAQV
jgi:hypothetical protein